MPELPRRCWEGRAGLKDGQGSHLEPLAAPRPSTGIDWGPTGPIHRTVLGFVDYRMKETAQHSTAEAGEHLIPSPPQLCERDTVMIIYWHIVGPQRNVT